MKISTTDEFVASAEIIPGATVIGADATIRRIGVVIRHRRNERGLMLNGLADRTGVSVSMLSMLERGAAGASIGTLVAVASALQMQMNDLFVQDRNQTSPVTLRNEQTQVQTGEGVLRRIAHHASKRVSKWPSTNTRRAPPAAVGRSITVAVNTGSWSPAALRSSSMTPYISSGRATPSAMSLRPPRSPDQQYRHCQGPRHLGQHQRLKLLSRQHCY